MQDRRFNPRAVRVWQKPQSGFLLLQEDVGQFSARSTGSFKPLSGYSLLQGRSRWGRGVAGRSFKPLTGYSLLQGHLS